jgi:hypothetical protein
MKKIPEDFDANIFVGRTLEMICFNANQIYFHFDHHLFITAETSFTFNKQGETIEVAVPALQSGLMQLLEHHVSKVSLEEQHILILVFDNEHELRFADNAPGLYESYRITIGDRTIII